MHSSVLLDSLLVASVAGTVTLGLVAAINRWLPSRSGHVRHQLTGYSLLVSLGVLAISLGARPGPVGCLTLSCSADPAGARLSGEASLEFTLVGAGKAALSDVPAPAIPVQPDAAWPTVILVVWLLGAGLFLGRAIHRRLRVLRLIRGSTTVTDRRVIDPVGHITAQLGLTTGVQVRRHPRIGAPAVAGVLKPVLFVAPGFEENDPAEIEMVLLHELAHLRRNDGGTTLLVELAAALFWFQPLMWRGVRRMRELQEVAADSRVLAAGVPATRYAQYLLDSFRALSHRRLAGHEAHSILGSCLMETRLKSILDPATQHRAPSRRLSLAMAAGFGLVTVIMASAPGSLQAMGYLSQAQRRGDGPDPARLNQASIDSLLRPVLLDKMADRYIPGSAIVVVSGDRIVYRGGFGRREVLQEIPVEVDRTIWRIGSITKVLTALAVMQLVDRGKLELNADVNQYLTALKVPGGFPAPVRVWNLLTHTSGFDQPGLGRHVSSREEVRPLGEFLSENLIRIQPPGELAGYDTYGITLAGYLVEQRSGLSYEHYLRENIFEPLEMYRSGIVIPPSLAGDVAVGYEFAGHWEAMPWEFMNTDPASTANATAPDMGNLLVMLLNGGRFKGRQILSEASVKAMLTRQVTNDPEQPGYGLTFWEDHAFGIAGFSHGGSMTGYGALLYLVPEHKFGVFIACNQETGALANAALSTLITSLFPGAARTPTLRPPFTGNRDVARFAGSYANVVYNHRHPDQGWQRRPFDVTVNDSGQVVFNQQPARRVGPLAFQRADGILVTFRENARKEITHMFVNQAAFERLR